MSMSLDSLLLHEKILKHYAYVKIVFLKSSTSFLTTWGQLSILGGSTMIFSCSRSCKATVASASMSPSSTKKVLERFHELAGVLEYCIQLQEFRGKVLLLRRKNKCPYGMGAGQVLRLWQVGMSRDGLSIR